MKNKIMKITIKAATSMAVAGVIIGTAGMTAKAADDAEEYVEECVDDNVNEYADECVEECGNVFVNENGYQLVPEAQCIDNFDEIEYVCNEGYEPVYMTTYVPEAQVIIGDAPIMPEIVSEDESGTIRAQLVPEAQYIDDLNEIEYDNRDGNEVIRTQAVPEAAPYIYDGPSLYKEMVPVAPVIIGSAPEECIVPAEPEVVTQETKPEFEKVTVSNPESYPFFGEVKRCYIENGPNMAFCLFIYYCPSPLGYEVIEYIEDELKNGDRGYTIDGVHYDCPEDDPYFADKHICYQNM